MAQTESQARAAMAHAERRSLDPPEDGPICPVCGEAGGNLERNGDEDGWWWEAQPCDACAAPCPVCRERGGAKDDGGRCRECNGEEGK